MKKIKIVTKTFLALFTVRVGFHHSLYERTISYTSIQSVFHSHKFVVIFNNSVFTSDTCTIKRSE
jgi:hypothetical protein